MLALRDVEVRYGAVRALRGVSLTVEPGEVVGLIGANGAGKTTLLSAVFGLARTHAGAIEFDGVSLRGLVPERIVRHGLALVPEGRHIFETLTVRENLRLGATALADRRALPAQLDAVLERFPKLAQLADTPAGRLSGGEQQQLAIGRALLSQPRLLMLDEPSLGLAPLIVDRVFEVLGELRQQGTTILLVEQNALRTVKFADRTYLLRAGEIVLSGGAELASADALRAAYVGA
ncbi:ABC transporter ATP-binding protein [Conexibacter woesei]|uniref:ABC transporter related protein n=1 Tax=Conexibacter woesei (strain DSM 14684 / CCUG 47730 / CIP 108061 / JCM 11494 / NBRC 100937 / ID131577) TaxID=469383 RepID=D3FAP7_CONWI|nr:ABC transporter ATP-binding protein [Conexibacter woesei]ADB51210.1 ABC transporter related protein [Conexibacter woesei DSM 14684]